MVNISQSIYGDYVGTYPTVEFFALCQLYQAGAIENVPPYPAKIDLHGYWTNTLQVKYVTIPAWDGQLHVFYRA